jgi:hypothetical protein
LQPAEKVASSLLSIEVASPATTDAEKCSQALKGLKNTFLLLGGAAVKNLGAKLENNQPVLLGLATLMEEIYVAESAILRAQKAQIQGSNYKEFMNRTLIYIHHSIEKSGKTAREIAYSISQGDEQKLLLLGIKRFTKPLGVDMLTSCAELGKSLANVS